MARNRHKILVILSDVDSSPQLLAALEELFFQELKVRIILIGLRDSQIAKEIRLRRWHSRELSKRNKVGSIINLFWVIFELILKRPRTLFASGQFATGIGIPASSLLSIKNRVFIRHHSNFHHKYDMKFGIVTDKIANKLSTKIIAVSEIVKEVLVEFENVPQKKIVLIHNGVELKNFKPKDEPLISDNSKTLKKSDTFNIGVISRLTEWKGVDYTAQAFVRLVEKYPKARLHIVGAFSDAYENVSKILEIVDPGTYSLQPKADDIPKFIQGLDVFVHVPIGKHDEAFGIVYIEALASEVDCIFTRSGIMNELDEPSKYVHIADFKSANSIFNHLEEIIGGKNEYKMPIIESWLNQFSMEIMAKKYCQELLAGK